MVAAVHKRGVRGRTGSIFKSRTTCATLHGKIRSDHTADARHSLGRNTVRPYLNEGAQERSASDNRWQQTITQRTEVFAGLVERVTFHNEDNGFCVLRVKAHGKREPITVVGQRGSPPASSSNRSASGTMIARMACSSFVACGGDNAALARSADGDRLAA